MDDDAGKRIKKRDESARTMRLDIRPDEGVDASSSAQERVLAGASAQDSSFIGRGGEALRSPDYEALLQSVYDAVVVSDGKGRILDFNARAVDFFPARHGDLTGANVIDLISGADESLLAAVRRNLEDHKYTLIEAKCIGRDGRMFPSEVAVNRIGLHDRDLFCFLFRDISLRKKAQQELEEAVARLEAHDRARLQFVSNVSHELRTPLTSMIYAVENMLRGVAGEISPRVRQYLDLLRGDCGRLLGTVNDILDMRKIELGDLQLSKVRLPVGRLVRTALESLIVQADRKEISIDMDLGERIWFASCDPQKMERVVLNIVGNAIKYTPDGGEVRVRLRGDPAHADRVRLSVVDTGIGIPPDAIDKVTLRYFTVGEQPSGSGLGLAIAKEIVELHDGALLIQSPVPGSERGTSVEISLPVASAPCLLIADGDREEGDRIERQASGQGYIVMRAFDGNEALRVIREERPDIVAVDLVLPGVPGDEVILKMKADKSIRHIPTLVLTGAEVGPAKADLLQKFAIPAIRKPWSEDAFLDALSGALLGNAPFRALRKN